LDQAGFGAQLMNVNSASVGGTHDAPTAFSTDPLPEAP
jgi:hypothetical protein